MAVNLEFGEYRATVVNRGAGLASLRFGGRDLVLPHPEDVVPEGFSGQVLVPWPNRVADASYAWQGETLSLEVNEPDTGAALHGLATDLDWEVRDCSTRAATLSCQIAPSSGYPFSLAVDVRYELGEDGLSITVTAKNTGRTPAPYGASVHPYLTCGVPVDQCTLEVPAATVLEVDDKLNPTSEVPVEGTRFDLRGGPSLSGRSIDHAFGDLPAKEWSVSLRRPDGSGVSIASRASWVQVYTGEKLDRMGVAVEPMTCPPNAFNTGRDLGIIEPGEGSRLEVRIYAV